MTAVHLCWSINTTVLLLFHEGQLSKFHYIAGKEQVLSEKFQVSLQEWYTLQIMSVVRRFLLTFILFYALLSHTQQSDIIVTIQGGGAGTSNKATIKTQAGYVAMGTGGFYSAQFDNISISTGIHIYTRARHSV